MPLPNEPVEEHPTGSDEDTVLDVRLVARGIVSCISEGDDIEGDPEKAVDSLQYGTPSEEEAPALQHRPPTADEESVR